MVVSKLVIDGIVWARIDRPAGVIVFQKPSSVDDVLNHWYTTALSQLLNVSLVTGQEILILCWTK